MKTEKGQIAIIIFIVATTFFIFGTIMDFTITLTVLKYDENTFTRHESNRIFVEEMSDGVAILNTTSALITGRTLLFAFVIFGIHLRYKNIISSSALMSFSAVLIVFGTIRIMGGYAWLYAM